MIIIRSSLLNKFENVIFGFSTKIGLKRNEPFFFNTSHSVGDNNELVEENRQALASQLGLDSYLIKSQKQIHSDIIRIADERSSLEESDALITNRHGTALAVSSADCASVFLYDPVKKVIAAIHSGWRGTQKNIAGKTIKAVIKNFNSTPDDLYAYISPSVSRNNYEVGSEVASLFQSRYIFNNNGKYYLDVSSAVYDQLTETGLRTGNIQRSLLCSYELKNLFHSYRRDGKRSGRAWGIIAMKESD
ncbi:MAG: peptidoglycan editing factor PgeF [Melioribacteraceae bacterium]|nr:peptidoglycan editing factor PgeF [Melioribacteraceae bacterium]